ncbi:hypothetical protein [Bacillus sp. FSL W8-0629]|uniref:hypothetical protein n=1 Tax=Bacillus sp. FSL W8-0629 TaxID=2954626 RepID=UPI00315866CB
MKNIKLRQNELPFPVTNFEDKTNKEFPFYQNGAKYALCPTCGSSVQIINGRNNVTQNRSKTIYAAHTKGYVNGLKFDENAKLNCPSYNGNAKNWQKIYKKRAGKIKNSEVEKYITLNIRQIALEVEQIIGFKCEYGEGRQSRLFNNLYNSFKSNDGLCIDPNQFVPDYIPRLIIERADPVKCWGAIPNNEIIKEKIKNNIRLEKSLDLGGQFKPDINVQLVGVLDDDNNPARLEIRLKFSDDILVLNRISANI